MTSLTTQVILLREFVSVFQGNELVIGAVLASWMMLTGAGAFLGRLSGPWPCGGSLPLPRLRARDAPPRHGAHTADDAQRRVHVREHGRDTPGTLRLASPPRPFCIFSGFLFTLFVHLISSLEGENRAARVYALESLGSHRRRGRASPRPHLAPRNVPGALCPPSHRPRSRLLPRMEREGRVHGRRGARHGGTGIHGLLVTDRADVWTRGFLFPGQDIVYFRDTPYGNLTLTRQGSEISFFENCMLMFSTNNPTPNEEAVHYCMVQRGSHRRVLLVGGGIAGTPAEILKYGVEGIDYVEINPWIIGIGKKVHRARSTTPASRSSRVTPGCTSERRRCGTTPSSSISRTRRRHRSTGSTRSSSFRI